MVNVSERSTSDAVKVIHQGSQELIHAVDAGSVAVSTAAVITELPKEEQSELVARGRDEILAMAKQLKAKAHVTNNSGDIEWYTPERIINMVREVLGGIDLDPASNEIANEVIGATTYYTAEQDGLKHPWRGRLFMNPPYEGSLVGRFCQKFCDEFDAGRVSGAIVLVNNATETAWFQLLSSKAAAVCFPLRRTRFWNPDKPDGSPLQGQAILFFDGGESDGIGRFGKVFSQIGKVWYSIEQ